MLVDSAPIQVFTVILVLIVILLGGYLLNLVLGQLHYLFLDQLLLFEQIKEHILAALDKNFVTMHLEVHFEDGLCRVVIGNLILVEILL